MFYNKKTNVHWLLLYPSPSPGACSNSCPLSQWCHPTISSSVVPFSSRLLSFPASGSFPMSQFFASGVQSIGASASASVHPMNIQDLFPLGLTGLIVQGKGFKSLLQHHSLKASTLWCSASLWSISHPYMTTGKVIALTRQTFVCKVTSLLFNMLSRLFIAFLSRSKSLWISWLLSSSTLILEPKKLKTLALWKKSYDKHRQHIKKQRCHFAKFRIVKTMVFQ